MSLGFKMEELDQYEEREPKNLHRHLFRLLVDWQRREYHRTVGAIVSACTSAGIGGEVKGALHDAKKN